MTETAAESKNKWDVAVHIPFTWSAPWNNGRDPEQIYALNSATVASCAAMTILSIDGGGFGVGQEFAWAAGLRLPVLLLHPNDQPPSRQAIGTPADLTVAAFGNAHDLAEAVRCFLRARSSSTLRRLVRVFTPNSTGRPPTFCMVRDTDSLA